MNRLPAAYTLNMINGTLYLQYLVSVVIIKPRNIKEIIMERSAPAIPMLTRQVPRVTGIPREKRRG